MQILTSTQTTGDAFQAPGWSTVIELTGYTGGAWQLQILAANGVWYAVDKAIITRDDLLFLRTIYGREYRLTGGVAGAEAFAIESLGVA